jgi:glutamate racemase
VRPLRKRLHLDIEAEIAARSKFKGLAQSRDARARHGLLAAETQVHDLNGIICNYFARLAESGEFFHPSIKKQLECLPGYDGVILGCTHYSFLREAIQEVFPDALLVESSKAVVDDIGRYLLDHALGNDQESFCRTSLYTSGDPELFAIKVRMLNICHDFLGSISLK